MSNLYSNLDLKVVSSRFNSLEDAFHFIRSLPVDDYCDMFSELVMLDDALSVCSRVYIVRYYKWVHIAEN